MTWNVAASGSTAPGPSPAASWNGCSPAAISLRERALWRLLYETAARANELLALNVEDLVYLRVSCWHMMAARPRDEEPPHANRAAPEHHPR
jgi:site-specific recombinase XerC